MSKNTVGILFILACGGSIASYYLWRRAAAQQFGAGQLRAGERVTGTISPAQIQRILGSR